MWVSFWPGWKPRNLLFIKGESSTWATQTQTQTKLTDPHTWRLTNAICKHFCAPSSTQLECSLVWLPQNGVAKGPRGLTSGVVSFGPPETYAMKNSETQSENLPRVDSTLNFKPLPEKKDMNNLTKAVGQQTSESLPRSYGKGTSPLMHWKKLLCFNRIFKCYLNI